jgi:hypothetical protein
MATATPQVPNTNQDPQRRVSWTLTIVILLTTAVGLTLALVGLVQYLSGQGGPLTNFHISLWNFGVDVPVNPPLEVMVIGVLVLVVPTVVLVVASGAAILKYLWGFIIFVGVGTAFTTIAIKSGPLEAASRMAPVSCWRTIFRRYRFRCLMRHVQ